VCANSRATSSRAPGLVQQEEEGDEVVFKLTDKGRAFVLDFIKVEKFAEAFGITI
jgi:predicted transcriptional regulator